MNKPIIAPATGSLPKFYALSGGQVIKEGTSSAQVAAFIARKRAQGYEIDCGADGLTPIVRQQRTEALENRVETYTVGYRIGESEHPGLFLHGIFPHEQAAAKHRAETLNDPIGAKYAIRPVNWRGARL